ncbi:MAG TPA: phosphotransferase, partial [Kiloniellaceae bacterium]|nr:phosphotransferase [Kiloniellaceae bacterium]
MTQIKKSTTEGSTDDRQDQAEAVAFLARPESYVALQAAPSAAKPLAVTRIDTHAAMVFLAGDKAVKIKRAVRYPYLDFSSLALRLQACCRELLLNRRTAPLLYEGLLALLRRDDGGLAFAGPLEPDDALPEGEVVEWALLMKRFDGDGLFSKLAARGALTAEMLDDLITEVLRFHEQAERLTGAPEAAVAGLQRVAEENLADFQRFPACFAPKAVAAHAARLAAVLDRQAPLLQARAAAGFRRHCHGDLHLGNICLWDGKPLIFDCLEFDDDLAEIDLLYDLAFLLMDLLQRDLPAF